MRTTYIRAPQIKDDKDGLCDKYYTTTDLAVRKYFSSSMVFHRFGQVNCGLDIAVSDLDGKGSSL